MVLVDEAGQEFDTTYLAGKKGLSAGWRGFSIHQNLHAGDALVFHLIAPTKFKASFLLCTIFRSTKHELRTQKHCFLTAPGL